MVELFVVLVASVERVGVVLLEPKLLACAALLVWFAFGGGALLRSVALERGKLPVSVVVLLVVYVGSGGLVGVVLLVPEVLV